MIEYVYFYICIYVCLYIYIYVYIGMYKWLSGFLDFYSENYCFHKVNTKVLGYLPCLLRHEDSCCPQY